MADERAYTIPLGEVFEHPKTKRAKLAISRVKKFLIKHMKADNVKIGDALNKAIWARGIQKPPRKVRIHTIKENDIIYADLIDVELKTPSKEELKKKEEKEKAKKEKIKEERKERRKKTIQDEIKEESGKQVADAIAEKISDVEAPIEKEEKAKESSTQKQTGKA